MEDEATEAEAFGIKQLIASLLSPATLAHVLLLVVASIALLATTSSIDGGAGYTAVLVTALVASQILTAFVASSDSGIRMLSVSGGNGFKARIVSSLRSLIIPLTFTTIIAGILLTTVAADEAARSTWAMVLAALFIAWSAGQALSFKAAMSAWVGGQKKTQVSEPKDGTLQGFIVRSSLEQIVIAGAIAALFGKVLPEKLGRTPDPLIWAGYFAASLGLFAIGIFLARNRLASSIKTVGGNARAHRWAFFCFAFTSWHLASLWRRVFTEPDDVVMLAEEATLMLLTVFTAVWSLSSKSMKGGSRLFTNRNALFWALAFGYGYSGSIIILTDLTDGLPLLGSLATTLGMGHGITALTLTLTFSAPLKEQSSTISPTGPTPDRELLEQIGRETSSHDATENTDSNINSESASSTVTNINIELHDTAVIDDLSEEKSAIEYSTEPRGENNLPSEETVIQDSEALNLDSSPQTETERGSKQPNPEENGNHDDVIELLD
jgi:hypothetical protein